MRTLTRLTPYLLAAGATLLAAACGDDGGGNTKADAAPSSPDANVDAAPVTPTRTGTVALTNVEVTTPNPDPSPGALPFLLGGPAFSISFEDITKGGGTVKIDTGTPGCSVEVFDCPAGKCPFHDEVDVGPVTITNVSDATPGIAGLKPEGCGFGADSHYHCPLAASAAADQTGTITIGNNVAALTIPAHTFDAKLRGTWLVASGFKDALAGLNGKAIPVAAVPGDHTLTLAGVPGTTGGNAVPVDGIGLSFIQGAGPVPNGAAPGAKIDWFGGTGQVEIKIAGSATNGYPGGIDQKILPGGAFNLNTTCDKCVLPHKMPTSIADNAPAKDKAVVFTCKDGNGTCGQAGMPLDGIAVSGTASNGSTATLKPFEMPKDGTKFVSFSCSAIGPELDISNEVWKEVLAIKPTRIETRVFKIGAPFPPVDATTKNSVRVLAGHGYVGHTDVPPP